MAGAIDILEKQVAAATELISSLRQDVERLSRQIEERAATTETIPDEGATAGADPAVREELERLRSERVALRDGIRRLIKEIDRVAW